MLSCFILGQLPLNFPYVFFYSVYCILEILQTIHSIRREDSLRSDRTKYHHSVPLPEASHQTQTQTMLVFDPALKVLPKQSEKKL
jgi:hypothetical protein